MKSREEPFIAVRPLPEKRLSEMTFDFDTEKCRTAGSLSVVDDFYRAHWLGLGPPYFPYSGVRRHVHAGDVLNAAVRLTKTNVRGFAASIPG